MFEFKRIPFQPDVELSRPPADFISLERAVGQLKTGNDDQGFEDGRETVPEVAQGRGNLVTARISNLFVDNILRLDHDPDDAVAARRVVELFETDQSSQFVVKNLQKLCKTSLKHSNAELTGCQ